MGRHGADPAVVSPVRRGDSVKRPPREETAVRIDRIVVVLEDIETGRELIVEIDQARPRKIDVDVYLANEAANFPGNNPRAHPPRQDEVERLAGILGVEATPRLRLDLHAAISGTLLMMLRGWKSPRWLRAMVNKERPTDPKLIAAIRKAKDAL